MYGPKDVDDHLKEVHANNYFKNDMELDFKGTKEQLVTQIYSLNAFGYQFYPQFHLVPIKVSEAKFCNVCVTSMTKKNKTKISRYKF